MPKEKKVRRLNTLFRKMYDETVQKQVGTEEYIGQVKEFIINYANLYINKTSLKGDAIDVSIEENRLKLSTNGKEFVDIGLNEEILNGNRNTNNKITKMNNIIEIAEDIGVELELKSLDLQNVKNDDIDNKGFYISAKDKAPTTKDAIDYSLRKLPQEDTQIANFWIDDEELISEYDIDNARRNTYLNVFESAINMETKTIKIEPGIKSKIVNDFIDKSAVLNEASYIEEQEMLELNEEELDINYSKPDILVLMHPEIIEKFNSLKDKYNSDGTLIEFDKLIELREHNISNILSDSRYTEENKDEMVIGVRESFAGIMYEKLVNDHSEVEVLDLRKRLGDDKFIEELNTIIETKGKIRDDNYNILKEFVDFSDSNMEKILENLDVDTKSSFKAFVETSRKDIEIREQELNDMQKKLDFIYDIKDTVEQSKDTIAKYTEEELVKADEEKLLRRVNVVGIIGNFYTGLKNGAIKNFEEWKQKRAEQKAKYEQEVEIDFDIEDDSNDIVTKEDELKEDEQDKNNSTSKDKKEKISNIKNNKKNNVKDNNTQRDYDVDNNTKSSRDNLTQNGQPEENTYINNTYNITNQTPKEPNEIEEFEEEPYIVSSLPLQDEYQIVEEQDKNEKTKNQIEEPIDIDDENEPIVSDEEEKIVEDNYNETIIEDKSSQLAEFATKYYEEYRASEIKRLDEMRMYYIDRAQKTVNSLYDNGTITLETAKRYLDSRQEEIDLKIGEEMEKLDEEGSKLYKEVIDAINLEKNIQSNLDEVYSEVSNKREELDKTEEKIEDIEKSGTLEELEKTEKRIEEDKNKEAEINGNSIS